MKFIHGQQAFIKCFHSILIHSKAEGCMGTDQHTIGAVKILPPISLYPDPRRAHWQVPLFLNMRQIRPETELT